MTTLIELDGAEVTYRRRGQPFVALHDVDLTIDAGERVGIVGGSGSGKTTIARLMLGLVEPSAGRVLFRGRPISGPTKDELRRTASLVYQDPNSSLDPRMRVHAIVAEPLRRRARSGEVEAVLESVGLDESHLRRFPHQLSGGQRQRVAIARALIAGPELLVADEPVSALDVLVRAQVLRLIREQTEARGLSLVMVSHDLSVVRELCDSVVVVHDGEVVEHGPTEAVFRAAQHPYTRSLLAATLTL